MTREQQASLLRQAVLELQTIACGIATAKLKTFFTQCEANANMKGRGLYAATTKHESNLLLFR